MVNAGTGRKKRLGAKGRIAPSHRIISDEGGSFVGISSPRILIVYKEASELKVLVLIIVAAVPHDEPKMPPSAP